MSFLNNALPLAQHSSTNLAHLAWESKEYTPMTSDIRSTTTASPAPTSSKPSSEFIRPSYESRWSESSAHHPLTNTRSTRRSATSTEFNEEEEYEDDELEFYSRRRSPRPTYHSIYSRSSLSIRLSQAFYLPSATPGPPPPLPPFPSEFFPEGLPRKYSPAASPVVGEFDPNADDERYFVTRSKRSVAASLKKQLKRMFKRSSESLARAL
ncbi:hypothetical protein FRC01_009544 [Tulasnella sp. 417]|nr:hypothetical protein FRC01_001783 [Tulasnella sp. 417]KAG8933383.1 hypothetical protein FRC01_009544 [Tulasnella sp. 417]